MRQRSLFYAAALAALLMTIPDLLHAGELGGRYPISGYFLRDRWGQFVVYSGTSVWFVSDEAAKTLAGQEGKPVKIDADVEQPMNPGGGVITKIHSVSPITFTDFALQATASQTVNKGDGLKLHLRVQNPLDKSLSLEPGHMEIVLATQHPFSNASIGYQDPEDRSYWYYESSVRRLPNTSVYQTAFHVVPLAWSPQSSLVHSQGVTIGERTPDFRPPGYFYPLVFQPQGEFETDVIVGQELSSGKYEAFLTVTGYEAGRLYPASAPIRFEVK